MSKIPMPNQNATGISERRILRAVLLGKESELPSGVEPGIDTQVAIVKELWRVWSDKNEKDWRAAKIYTNRKELARYANQHEMKMGYIMARFSKKCESYLEYEQKNSRSNDKLDSLLSEMKRYIKSK